jgi:long-subunit acyl-CoA synthetase (AMP-forming)
MSGRASPSLRPLAAKIAATASSRAGSAPIAVELQHRLEAKLGVPVLQVYASTEASSIAQEPLPPAKRRDGSVGIVFPFTIPKTSAKTVAVIYRPF